MPLLLLMIPSRRANNNLSGCAVGKEDEYVDVGRLIDAGTCDGALQVRQCETHTHVIGAVGLVPEPLLGIVPGALVGGIVAGCELFGILCPPPGGKSNDDGQPSWANAGCTAAIVRSRPKRPSCRCPPHPSPQRTPMFPARLGIRLGVVQRSPLICANIRGGSCFCAGLSLVAPAPSKISSLSNPMRGLRDRNRMVIVHEFDSPILPRAVIRLVRRRVWRHAN